MEKKENNTDDIILDLCGGTGAWSKPYKDAGYNVRVITLPEQDIFDYIPPKGVYGILAAPPCTHFSMARTTATEPRNLKNAFETVRRCLEIIWECQYDEKTHLKFWALENPMGLLRRFLGRPPFTFDPCDYGDPYTKKTDLWGFYNIPKMNKVPLTDQQMRDCSINNRILPKIPDGYIIPTGTRPQAVRRAITPSGFAYAFYKANCKSTNGGDLHGERPITEKVRRTRKKAHDPNKADHRQVEGQREENPKPVTERAGQEEAGTEGHKISPVTHLERTVEARLQGLQTLSMRHYDPALQ